MTLRSNTVRMGIVALLAAGLAVALTVLLFPSKGTSAGPTYSALVRLAAQYDMFDGDEFYTEELPADGAAGGQAIFETAVTTRRPTPYVTVSGTGSARTGEEGGPVGPAHLELGQRRSCSPLRQRRAAAARQCRERPAGCARTRPRIYTTTTSTWCRAITPGSGPRHVQVKMASSDGGTVFMETSHFFVDASTLAPHGCDQANTPDGFEEEGPSKASHNG
jgi:hypothetical protein